MPLVDGAGPSLVVSPIGLLDGVHFYLKSFSELGKKFLVALLMSLVGQFSLFNLLLGEQVVGLLASHSLILCFVHPKHLAQLLLAVCRFFHGFQSASSLSFDRAAPIVVIDFIDNFEVDASDGHWVASLERLLEVFGLVGVELG